MPLHEALSLAEQQELDLVEVAPDAQPPVCRLLDYGKFRYLQKNLYHSMLVLLFLDNRIHLHLLKQLD